MTDGRDSTSPDSSRQDPATAPAGGGTPDDRSGAADTSSGTGPRDVDPAAVTRKLLMGLALILALGSVYVGVFNWPKPLQMMLAAGATIALVSALRRPAGEPPRRK